MSGFRATPYARALFDVIGDAAKAEKLLPQLEALAAALDEAPEFRIAMESPAIKPERKEAILDEILSYLKIGEPIRRFAHVLQLHYRLKFAAEITRVFRGLINRGLGRVDARIEVPAPLLPKEEQQLIQAIGSVAGAEIQADFVEKPELLAGFRVQIGSRVFDASVDGQLKKLGRKARQV